MEENVRTEPFTKVPSRLLEHLAKMRFARNEFRTVMVLIRKTYGYHKDKDKISISQFQLMTGLDRKNQSKALMSLVARRVFNKEIGFNYHTYSLNTNYVEWAVVGQPLSMTPAETDRLVAFRSRMVVSAEQISVAGQPRTIDIVGNII